MKPKNLLIAIVLIFLTALTGYLGYEVLIKEPVKKPDVKVPEEVEEIVTTPEREEKTTVAVFFNREGVDECDKVFPTRREIEAAPQIGTAALEELLNGPTQKEQEDGYLTNIPEGVRLSSLTIEDGIATADFSEEMDQVAGSCRVQAIREQITMTLMQFSTVEDVIITVEGRQEEVLQP